MAKQAHRRRRTKSSRRTTVAAVGGETEICVYGDIGWSWTGDGVTAKRVKEELDEAPEGDTIVVRINSYGGDAFEGVAIYNLLSQDKRRVVTKIDGAAISAASIIAMAGSERAIAENGMLMIHDPWTFAMGNADEMRTVADALDMVAQALCKTYERRSDKSFEELREMMREEAWLGAEEAVESGLCTSVMVAEDDDEPAEMEDLLGPIAARMAATFRHAPASLAAMANARRPDDEDPLGSDDIHAICERLGALGGAVAAMARHDNHTRRERGNETTKKDESMNIEELQAALKAAQNETVSMRQERDDTKAALDAAQTEAKAATEEVAKLQASKQALESQNEKLVAERDEACTRAEAAEEKVISAEVEALVGDKIDPAEREQFLQLRKKDPELFTKFVEQRAPKRTLSADPAGMGPEPMPESINDSDGNGWDSLVEAATR